MMVRIKNKWKFPNHHLISYKSADIDKMFYGDNHPMKPIRIVMAHDLIVGYGLYQVIIVNN